MRQIASVFLVAFLCLSPVLSGDKGLKDKKGKDKKEEKKEKKTLVGTWRVLSVHINGVMIEKGAENAKITIRPGWMVMTGPRKDSSLTMKVDFEKAFGPIDFTQDVPASRSSPARVENLKGLFKMKEDDLTIVWGLPPARKGADGKLTFGDSVRPESVNERKGNFQIILKREGGGKQKEKN